MGRRRLAHSWKRTARFSPVADGASAASLHPSHSVEETNIGRRRIRRGSKQSSNAPGDLGWLCHPLSSQLPIEKGINGLPCAHTQTHLLPPPLTWFSTRPRIGFGPPFGSVGCF